MSPPTFHVAVFPWFAEGHIIPFLNLSNRLAERGCRVSFFIPTKTSEKFRHLNLHPHLIHFIPLIVPQVEDLPPGVETMSDVRAQSNFVFLTKAFDLTQDQVQTALHKLHPDIIIFDFSQWLPRIAHSMGIKCIFYLTCGPAVVASVFLPLIMSSGEKDQVVAEPRDDELSFFDRVGICLKECDAICFRGYRKLDGELCDQIRDGLSKQVLLMGMNLPEPSNGLEEKWDKWLGGFEKGSVVYCAFGSECVLEKDQFHELVLGLELTGLPFLARLKPPQGAETVEEALPEGFEERVRGKGVVHGGWVQQQQILSHPSVGCFVSHCGYGSMCESLVSTCQIVLIPYIADQFLNASYMTNKLKVGVEVERREEDKWFTRDGVCKAVMSVMEEGSEVGQEIRANHHELRELLSTEDLEITYLDNFLVKLQEILK